jgi:hypothetical protein
MKYFKIFLSLALIVVSILTLNALVPDTGVIWGTLVFVAPGGIGANFQFNMTYLPEWLYYNDAAAPLNFLRVETKEDGMLHDWNAAAIAAVNGYLHKGALAANDVVLRVASGRIDGKNVTVTGQTSAAGAINIFAAADNSAGVAFKTHNAAILALNPTRFEKFTAVFLPALVTVTDRAEVTFSDGHTEIFDAAELQAYSTLYQEAPGIIVNNIDGYIKHLDVIAAIAQAAYVFKVNM